MGSPGWSVTRCPGKTASKFLGKVVNKSRRIAAVRFPEKTASKFPGRVALLSPLRTASMSPGRTAGAYQGRAALACLFRNKKPGRSVHRTHQEPGMANKCFYDI